ncbi:MAG: SRPBCC family protein [Anaerolineae bacterium]|nr:SRPBCC family protein [Anaerolineae bacterium]
MDSQCLFDPAHHTSARQQTEGWVDFQFSPDAVFARVSDHASMGDWIPMVHAISVTHPHPVGPGASAIGTARHITFRGGLTITETVVYWNPPYCYAYSTEGKHVPLKNYIGLFTIEATGEHSGRLIMREYFELGRVEQSLLPHGIVSTFRHALGSLAKLTGGTQYAMTEISLV